ncbi:MAG: flagella basal body P-ring formation protein FlgA [Parvularculaceae bacterium]
MMKPFRVSGVAGYLTVLLWLLLTIGAARAATATEPARVADLRNEIVSALTGVDAPADAPLLLDAPFAATPTLADAAPTAQYDARTGRFVVRFATVDAAPFAVSGSLRAPRQAEAPASRPRDDRRAPTRKDRGPTVIDRGDAVTIVFEAPGMRLANRGLAQERGAVGDVIEIETIRSARAVKAIVTGAGQAAAIGASQ